MNDFTYMGFLFGLGFTFGSGFLVSLGLGVTSIQRKISERIRQQE